MNDESKFVKQLLDLPHEGDPNIQADKIENFSKNLLLKQSLICLALLASEGSEKDKVDLLFEIICFFNQSSDKK